MAMQIKRRIGSAGAPPTLVEGQLGYNDPGSGAGDALFIGSAGNAVKTLVSSARQVELDGAQTIIGKKTIAVGDLKLTGGANNAMLVTDGNGNLSFTSSPEGGLLSVSTDDTIDGDGSTENPLSVVKMAESRSIHIQHKSTGGTKIAATAASFDGSDDALITDFEITALDDGSY
jgi:hypothetical protein